MVARFWLQSDMRDRSYNYGSFITQDMLDESYKAQENQLELVVDVGNFSVADRPKYLGTRFYEGRMIDLPKAERIMPEMLSANVEFSECKITISNIDGKYTEYLPGGSQYSTFQGVPVSISMGLRDVQESLIPIFSGVVSYENGVSFSRNDITFKFRDRLEKLNTKYPLESITIDNYPEVPESNIGKLIPLHLGDWTGNWEWQENGTFSYPVGDSTLNVINVTPVGYGAGMQGIYVSPATSLDTGGVFLFNTGGRAGKTYHPLNIEDVVIKRGSNYLQASFQESPVSRGGHWCVIVDGIKGRTITDEIIIYTYQYSAGDEAIIKCKIPITGYDWLPSRDCNPLEQALEALFALARIDSGEIDFASWAAMRDNIGARGGGTQLSSISAYGVYPNPTSFFGKKMYIDVLDHSDSVVGFCVWFQNEFYQPHEPEPAEVEYRTIITVPLYQAEEYTAYEIIESLKNSLEQELIVYATLKIGYQNDEEAWLNIDNLVKGPCPAINVFDTGLTAQILRAGTNPSGLRTRIAFNDATKTVIGSVASLLKCVLVDVYVNSNLDLAFSSIWPQDWPTLEEMPIVNQYDISEDTISVSSEPRVFLTEAQANFSWIPWLNTNGGTTKKIRNDNADYLIQRTISKEFDVPSLYREDDALDVLAVYVRLASASLVTITMELGWRHLLLDLGDFISLNIKSGNLNYENVPCQVRKISILPKVTGSEVQLVSFINFSYPNYVSPSHARNLSSWDVQLTNA